MFECFICGARATDYVKYVYAHVDLPTSYRAVCEDCVKKHLANWNMTSEEEYLIYHVMNT